MIGARTQFKIWRNSDLVPACWHQYSDPKSVWCFNPGLLRWRGQWVLVYRLILGDQKRRIALCRLNDAFEIIDDSVLALSDLIQFAPDADYSPHVKGWFADPRIFFLGTRIFVYFNSGWHAPHNHQFLVELSSDTLHPLPHACELLLSGRRQTIEKNWTFFGSDPYYVVYSPSPHRVLKAVFTGRGGIRCEPITQDTWPVNSHDAPELPRGGSPPFLLGDGYYSFCHRLQNHPGGVRYAACVYRFSAGFPFKPTHMPCRALALPIPQQGNRQMPRLNPAVDEVVYPGGAVFHEGLWHVSYGINDEHCAMALLPSAEVDGAMRQLSMSTPLTQRLRRLWRRQ